MTAPHIGNTGVNGEDDESSRIWVAGFVVRDPARAPVELAGHRQPGRRAGAPGRRRHQRRRHPGADPAPARARRHAGRASAARSRPGRRCSARVRRRREHDRRRPRRRGEHRRALRRAGGGGEAVHDRRARPRHQDARPRGTWPSSASRPTCCRRRPPPRSCWPPARTASSSPTARATRRPPTTRSRRCAGVLDARRAAVRHLLRQPDPRPRAGPGHLQAALRPPRAQPAGARPGQRHGAGDQPQPRLRRRRAARPARPTPRTAGSRSATSASTTTSSRACAASTCRPSACSTTPRRRPARTTRHRCSSGSST